MAEIETRVTTLEQQVSNVMTKLDMFIAESREARQRQDADIREAREKHEADMREIRERQEAAQAKHDAEMHEMNQRFYGKFDDMNAKIDAKFASMNTKIEGIGNHVRNITIAAMVGIGAAVTGVAAMVVAIFLK